MRARMLAFKAATATCLVLGQSQVAVSQTAPLSGSASIGGMVYEQNGTPVRRAEVCATHAGYRSCVNVDSGGAYLFTGLKADRLHISVVCNISMTLPFYRSEASDTIQLVEDAVTIRDWQISTAGCDQRVVRRIAGTFRGHYTYGFEESSFHPCPQDAWFLTGDSLHLYKHDAHYAWVDWVQTNEQHKWPDPPGTGERYPRVYVELRGTVTGPAPSGHMGVAPFLLAVDSLLVARVPSGEDCRNQQ